MKIDNFFRAMLVMGIICIVMAFGAFLPSQWDKERANGLRLDNCIKLVNEIGIDVNDTQARSNFLQNCYEK